MEFTDLAISSLIATYRLIILFRYFRLLLDLVQIYGYICLKPGVILSKQMRLKTSQDVTIIACSLGLETKNFSRNIQLWLLQDPKALIIATIDSSMDRMRAMVEILDERRISICSVSKPNRLAQTCAALRLTNTKIVVFVDERVTWSPNTLSCLTASFTDARVGGAITSTRMSMRRETTMWEKLGALNLIRRNVLHAFLAYFNEGQVLNLGGRTMTFRTEALKNEDFYEATRNDIWRGRYRIQTGDDNFLTNWILHHGWRTVFINQTEASIVALVNNDISYLQEVLRWSRDTARSYLRDIQFSLYAKENRHYLRALLNCLANYASDFSIILELGCLFLLTISPIGSSEEGRNFYSKTNKRRLWIDHLAIVSILQVIEHLPFFQSWQAIAFIPATILYLYIHALIVITALFTLNESTWRSLPQFDAL